MQKHFKHTHIHGAITLRSQGKCKATPFQKNSKYKEIRGIDLSALMVWWRKECK